MIDPPLPDLNSHSDSHSRSVIEEELDEDCDYNEDEWDELGIDDDDPDPGTSSGRYEK